MAPRVVTVAPVRESHHHQHTAATAAAIAGVGAVGQSTVQTGIEATRARIRYVAEADQTPRILASAAVALVCCRESAAEVVSRPMETGY